MENYVTIVLDDQEKTYDTLHARWKLSDTNHPRDYNPEFSDKPEDGHARN